MLRFRHKKKKKTKRKNHGWKSKKSLELAIKQIDKAFGKGTLIRLGDKEVIPTEAISTGSLGLDLALELVVLPKGRVIEIYGPESSGKTTLTLHAIAEAQKRGEFVHL